MHSQAVPLLPASAQVLRPAKTAGLRMTIEWTRVVPHPQPSGLIMHGPNCTGCGMLLRRRRVGQDSNFGLIPEVQQ
jgi:hypothetical protein